MPVMGILFFAHFVNDFYSLLLPIFIPLLIRELNISYFYAGVLVSVVAIIGAILQSPVGYCADIYRKRVFFLTVGFLFYATGVIVLGLSNRFSFLLGSAILIGLASTTYHPQSTNLITKKFYRKGQALGIHGVGGQLGRFLSPIFIGWLVSKLQWRVAAIFLMLPAMVAVFLCGFGLKEPTERGEPGLVRAITLPIIFLILILGLRSAVFQGIVSFLPSFLVVKGSSIDVAGLLTGIMLGIGLISQPIGGALGDRVSKPKIIFISLLGLAILFFLFQFILLSSSDLNYPFLICLLVGIGFCIFVTFPLGLALSAELSPGERIGTSVGAVSGGGMVLPALILPVVGHLIDNYDFHTGFLFLGILTVVATIVSIGYLKMDPQ